MHCPMRAVAEYFTEVGLVAQYEYDFGDSWIHEVRFEKSLPSAYLSNSRGSNCDWRMIDLSVPRLISAWLGTGTVMVEPAILFCMTM